LEGDRASFPTGEHLVAVEGERGGLADAAHGPAR
jgi:hypothetical protein